MIRAVLAAAILAYSATPGAAACRQALAIGLDVSGSVDLREYRLQLDGLVSALNAPAVRRVLLAMPDAPVSLLVFEWSGPDHQLVLVPWTAVDSEQTLTQVSTALALTERRPAAPGTALGLAMQKGASYLSEQPQCWKRTLDISGDGKSNLGPAPRNVRDSLMTSGITINGLAIGSDAPAIGDQRQTDIAELSAYFRTEVIAGPDAFVQTAIGFEDYAEAMAAKLERELQGLVIGRRQ